MGTAKTEHFSEQENEIAMIFKALGHPARVAIVESLAKKGSCVCGEIVEELPLAQATVSQHLKELKAAGIIQGTIEGTHTCYCLAPDALAKAAAFLARLSALPNLNCC